MKCFAIETRLKGADNWCALSPASVGVDPDDLPGPAAMVFDSRESAELFIEDNMPPGYEAQIVELDMDILAYHGPKH
jgi:hypothetical protein